MIDITELTSVQKNANIHRLSRLIAYAPNDELRQLAVEVEQYTEQLIEALEKAQQRIDELENDEVRQRLANAEHQLYMAELAKHNLKASRKAQFRKRRAAEKRIAELEESNAQVIQSAPVVPDKMTYQDGVLFVLNNDMSSIERGTVAMRAWNACRAAMLQAGNSPVIPEGYVMVPKEPTERMVIDGFESEPDETFSEPEVWEAFQKMSGCEQAAFRARLCWAAMLAAAPQEVKGE